MTVKVLADTSGTGGAVKTCSIRTATVVLSSVMSIAFFVHCVVEFTVITVGVDSTVTTVVAEATAVVGVILGNIAVVLSTICFNSIMVGC